MLLHLFGKLQSISREEVDTGKRSRQRQGKSTGYISSVPSTAASQQQHARRGFVPETPFSWNLSGPGKALCHAILRSTTSQTSCPELTGFVPKACDLKKNHKKQKQKNYLKTLREGRKHNQTKG